MGLQGAAALVGIAENRPEKLSAGGPSQTTIEQIADLVVRAVDDAGLSLKDVDGLSVVGVAESDQFAPATVSEYLGTHLHFADTVDLGGASSVAMIWRAAAAVELGLADVVVCASVAGYAPIPPGADLAALAEAMRFGASSYRYGSPQAEFEIPYGHLAQNAGYAMIAQRYADRYGYDPAAMARLVVHQRENACANPAAIFHGKPLTEQDVLDSRMIASPIHMLEIVMPVTGGGAVVVASRQAVQRCRHRPAWVTGCGEYLAIKSVQYADDMLATPIGPASRKAFDMAAIKPADIDLAQIYDCYTITVLLTLEDAGFCSKGEGMQFIREHNFTWHGDFPMNTHGGQLGFGQPGLAGGMTQVAEAVRQIAGRTGSRQLGSCDNVYVSGTGGVMSEQAALILRGD